MPEFSDEDYIESPRDALTTYFGEMFRKYGSTSAGLGLASSLMDAGLLERGSAIYGETEGLISLFEENSLAIFGETYSYDRVGGLWFSVERVAVVEDPLVWWRRWVEAE